MRSEATTVESYLAALPDDRREAIAAVREVILEYLPEIIGYCPGIHRWRFQVTAGCGF